MPEKKDYSEVYQELDPIIKESPEMNFNELKEKHESIAERVSYGAFLGRRRKLLGNKSYTYARRTKVKRVAKRKDENAVDVEMVGSVSEGAKMTEREISEFVKEYAPNSKNQGEYKQLFKIFLKKPDAIYTDLKRRGIVTLSDPMYYTFKNKALEYINRNKVSHKKEKPNGKPQKSEVSFEGDVFKVVLSSISDSEDVITEACTIVEKMNQETNIEFSVVELKTGYEIRRRI